MLQHSMALPPPSGPRLAGRLTADLILSSPQGFNAVKDYSIDLRGTPKRCAVCCRRRIPSVFQQLGFPTGHCVWRLRPAGHYCGDYPYGGSRHVLGSRTAAVAAQTELQASTLGSAHDANSLSSQAIS